VCVVPPVTLAYLEKWQTSKNSMFLNGEKNDELPKY
jgi:hypothetical protein